ncbi:VWA domain-containing protein, partial [Acidobacteria bacterium AH-259-O06]|nr:VWA domain-containing protein [Acidobacteria bacterium AH-259-O06]
MWRSENLKIIPFLLFLLLFAASDLSAQKETPRFRVESEIVRVPVVVIGEGGRLYTDLSKENFTLLEDKVAQTISKFIGGESPLTLVLLLEYSGVIRYLRGEVIRPAGIFVSQIMGPDDYAAIVAFDMRPELLTDFTRNRQQLMDAVNALVYSPPGFSESNLFDALKFVLSGGELEGYEYKGLSQVEGRTGVLIVATGMNTFSKTSYDEIQKVVADSGVPVYSIGIGELAYIRAEPYLSGLERLNFLQAQNTLRAFSQTSAGRFYSVRFQAALDSVLESIAAMLRYQYTLGYTSTNPRREGKKRKIEVLVDVNGDGQP